MDDEKQGPEVPVTEADRGSRSAGILGAVVLTASPFLLLLGMWWLDRFLR